MLGGFVGAKSWKHLEATRLLAIQELTAGWREASTIETLIRLQDVVAKFDGVFEKVVPQDVEIAAFMEWKPSQLHRNTSPVLIGKTLFHQLFGYEGTSRPRLDLLCDGRTYPLEDWIDTDDPELMARMEAVFERMEQQLLEKDLPPPPDHGPDPE
jgi:hypothetical protein